jgi:hypothetical protein
MLRKVFLQTQFGVPHEWTRQYIQQFSRLAKDGWFLKIFTPNDLPPGENVEIVPMTLEEFDALIEKHCGVHPGNFIQHGRPHKLVSDYYPAYGQIFQDFIRGFDYWGFTNWDMVYGRLSHFLSDYDLEMCDVWSDDVNTINGIFTLLRNEPRINALFRSVPGWQEKFTDHAPQAFDEHHFTEAVRRLVADRKISFGYPLYGGLHSYDRLAQHQPTPRLRLAPDGALVELFNDVKGSAVQHYNQETQPGHEIFSFHFSSTKRWPL